MRIMKLLLLKMLSKPMFFWFSEIRTFIFNPGGSVRITMLYFNSTLCYMFLLIIILELLEVSLGNPRAQIVDLTCGNQLQHNPTYFVPHFIVMMGDISDQMRTKGFGIAITGSRLDTISLFISLMPRKNVITIMKMIPAYMEFAHVDLAVEIFDNLSEKHSVSFNATLAGYCQNIELSAFTLSTTLKTCALLTEKKISEQPHGFVLKFGYEVNKQIASALLEMCTWCGRMTDAQKMIVRWPLNQDWIPKLLEGFISCLGAFTTIISENISQLIRAPMDRSVTEHFESSVWALDFCKAIHDWIEQIRQWQQQLQIVLCALTSCTAPCHDIASWNSLLDAHVFHRKGDEALATWAKMVTSRRKHVVQTSTVHKQKQQAHLNSKK